MMGILYDIYKNPGIAADPSRAAENEPEWKKEIRERMKEQNENGNEEREDPDPGSGQRPVRNHKVLGEDEVEPSETGTLRAGRHGTSE